MVLESMMKSLRAIGIYDLTSPVILAELYTYADELELLYTELDAAADERFLSTARGEGLRIFEEMFGPARDGMSLSQRRELLRKRLTLGGGDFTPAGIRQALDSFNLSYTISEYPRQNRLNIIATTDYPKSEQAFIRREVQKIVPAHLDVQLVFNSLSWAQLDARECSFSQLDNDNLTWEQIDSLE